MECRLRKTDKLNLIYFMVSYFISNLVSGVMYDTYINYMYEVAKPISLSFWSFYGYATFLSAILMLLIPKFGYRMILLLSNFCNVVAFTLVTCTTDFWCLGFSTLISLTGLQLHFGILSPFVSVSTDRLDDGGIKWFTRIYYVGYIAYFLSTYLGGVAVVKIFAMLLGGSFRTAKELTRYIDLLTAQQYSMYLVSNRYVMLIMALISGLGLIPIYLIKDINPKVHDKISLGNWRDKIKSGIKVVNNRNAQIYLLYWVMISFAMGLFTSYYTVYLNRNLHIDKATASLMVSLSYMAVVIFMLFTPCVVRVLGRVVTIAAAVIFSVPFMMIIAFGELFGSYMIPAVGIALFIRAGLANISSPAESSLSMSLVPKELRPAYAAVINFASGIISILSGEFTGKVLFVTQPGYRYAYYIASIIYLIAGAVVMIGLRNHNREVLNE